MRDAHERLRDLYAVPPDAAPRIAGKMLAPTDTAEGMSERDDDVFEAAMMPLTPSDADTR